MFSTLVSVHGENGRIVIKVEGADTAAILPDGTGGSHGHTTGLAIVECEAGNKVWIQCAEDGTRIYASSAYHYNTFSGMLVDAFK